MVKYIIKKLIILIVTVLAVSFVIFMLFSIIPSDPAVNKLGINATEESLAALRTEYGLEGPVLVRYFRYIGGVCTLDFGKSYTYGMKVSQLIGERIFINIVLSLMSLIIVTVISIPVGMLLAHVNKTKWENFIEINNQIVMSVPPFLLGIILTFIFGIVFKFFSPGRYIAYNKDFWGFMGYMICPALALSLPKCAMCIRLLRSSILEEKKKDYVKVALAKGNSNGRALYKHILVNAIMPTITFISMILADMIAQGIVVEQVFALPGLGRCLLNAISTRDYPVIEGIILIIATSIVVIGTLNDIIHAVIDPRIREDL